jgi:hypothetical protein
MVRMSAVRKAAWRFALQCRHAGLDPASTFLRAWAKEGGPRIESGVTVVWVMGRRFNSIHRHAGLDPASTFFPGRGEKKVDPGSSPG